MKKIFLILVAASGLASANNYNDIVANNAVIASDVVPMMNKEESLVDIYLRSIIPGLLIGSVVGAASGYFDHILPDIYPLTWLIAYLQRTSLVNMVSSDMQAKNITHHKSVMDLLAFASSWLVYYKTYQEIHGTPPFFASYKK